MESVEGRGSALEHWAPESPLPRRAADPGPPAAREPLPLVHWGAPRQASRLPLSCAEGGGEPRGQAPGEAAAQGALPPLSVYLRAALPSFPLELFQVKQTPVATEVSQPHENQ